MRRVDPLTVAFVLAGLFLVAAAANAHEAVRLYAAGGLKGAMSGMAFAALSAPKADPSGDYALGFTPVGVP